MKFGARQRARSDRFATYMKPKLMADMMLIFRRSSMFNLQITRVGTKERAKSYAINM